MQTIVPHPADNSRLLVSHAAWDVHAVHGVHAVYSVKVWVQLRGNGPGSRRPVGVVDDDERVAMHDRPVITRAQLGGQFASAAAE
jgi:hypothetical protein